MNKELSKGKIIESGTFSDSLGEIADYFHPTRCETFAPDDDDYHFGIRGNHYAIIYGWSEMHPGNEPFHVKPLALVIGNHKGNLAYAVIETEDN